MRKLLFAALALTNALSACTESGQTRNDITYGTVIYVNDEQITLSQDGGSTTAIALPRQQNTLSDIATCFLHDSVAVAFHFDGDGKPYADKLFVIKHSNPTMNNVSAMLVGKWRQIDTNGHMAMNLCADATANVNDVAVQRWNVSGKDVNIVCADKNRSFKLLRVDARTLCIADESNNTLNFKKE